MATNLLGDKDNLMKARNIQWEISHLHPRLSKVQPHGQLLPGEHVGVLGLLEGSLKLVQLEGGEGGARPTDLPRLVRVIQLPVLEAERQVFLFLLLLGVAVVVFLDLRFGVWRVLEWLTGSLVAQVAWAELLEPIFYTTPSLPNLNIVGYALMLALIHRVNSIDINYLVNCSHSATLLATAIRGQFRVQSSGVSMVGDIS